MMIMPMVIPCLKHVAQLRFFDMFSALGLTSKIVMQKYYQIFSEHGFRALVRSWSYIFSTFLS